MVRRFAACALCVLAIPVLSLALSFVLSSSLPSLSRAQEAVESPAGAEAENLWLPLVATRNSLSSGLAVSVTTDAATAVSKVIPPTGGSLVATGADGDTFTLTIPDGALLVTTTVTMTPVTALTGAPVGALTAGVQIAPDMLGLWQPATLRVVSVPAVPVASEVSFGWFGAGQDFHLYPLHPDPAIVQFEITRLHGYGFGRVDVAAAGGESEAAERGAAEAAGVEQAGGGSWSPQDLLAQHAQQMQDLLRQERENQLAGREGDPELWEKLVEILRQSFHGSVAPLKQSMMTNCAVAEAHLPLVLHWMRQVELLGMAESLAAEMATLDGEFFTAIFKNCIKEAAEPCFDEGDPFQMVLILGYERNAQLIGVETGLDLDALPKCQIIMVDLDGARNAFFAAQEDVEDGWETKMRFRFADENVSTVLWMHPFNPLRNTGVRAEVDVVALVDGTWRTFTDLDSYQCRDRKAQRVEELIMTIRNVEGVAPFAPQVYATDIGCWKWHWEQQYESEFTADPDITDKVNWSIDTVLKIRNEHPLVWLWNSFTQEVEIGGSLQFVLDDNGTFTHEHVVASAVLECSSRLTATYEPPMPYLAGASERNITIVTNPASSGFGMFNGGVDVANSTAYRGSCNRATPTLLPAALASWVGNEGSSGKLWSGIEAGSLPEQSGTWSRSWTLTAIKE